VLPNGITSFQALQNRTAATQFTYFAFDLLYLEHADLRERPLVERKKQLRRLLGRKQGVIRFSDHVVGDGEAFFAAACRMGLEGIVSKRATARYRKSKSSSVFTTGKCAI
jgi:bifunctional non-homologous end joining protein LigD